MAPPPARGESSLQHPVPCPTLRPVNVMLAWRRVSKATQKMEIGSAKLVEESGIERMAEGENEVARVRQMGLIHRRMMMKSTDESSERSTNQKRIESEKAREIARRDGVSTIGAVEVKAAVEVPVEVAAEAMVETAMILLVAKVARMKRDQ